MSVCPKCENVVDGDFGVVACPSCQAVLFFDMDGVPHLNSEPPEEILLVEDEVASSEAYSMPESYEASENLELSEEISSKSSEEIVLEKNFYEEPAPIAKAHPPGSFADIEEFGNSEQVAGELSYTIRIVGIDTEKIRSDLHGALADARLFRDLDKVLANVKRGTLVIADLSPVKAAVVLQRIKALPVDISWSQNAKNSDSATA